MNFSQVPPVCLPHAPELTEASFTDETEKMLWPEAKWDSCSDGKHPGKLHKNWRLTERWFEKDKGQDKDQDTKICEGMDRSGTDLAATSSLLAVGEPPKGKHKSNEERHKAGVSRVKLLAGRFGKTLANCESSLPGMRRKCTDDTYRRLKNGVAACRTIRDEVLDEFEDLKTLPPDHELQEAAIDSLSRLQRTLTEHSQAMMEAWQAQKEPMVVKQDDDENMDDQMGMPSGLCLHIATPSPNL